MVSREETKSKTEQHLYDVALSLFCEVGYRKTTLIDIASEAKVSTRTLYRYFPTKDSILKKFVKENLSSLRVFADELPSDMPIKEKIIAIMVEDFRLMFCLFDMGIIVHSAHNEAGEFNQFEIDNILSSESLYRNLFITEQQKNGLDPNSLAALCASIIMSIYRHCNDLYRFKRNFGFKENDLRGFFGCHVDAVWESLYAALLSSPKQNSYLANLDESFFD